MVFESYLSGSFFIFHGERDAQLHCRALNYLGLTISAYSGDIEFELTLFIRDNQG